MRQRGFTLLEMLCVLSICAVLAVCALPSMAHSLQQGMLQSAVTDFKWTYERVPVMPSDPTWQVNGNTWSKAFARPAGMLTVTTPTTTGGPFACSFSQPGFVLRC